MELMEGKKGSSKIYTEWTPPPFPSKTHIHAHTKTNTPGVLKVNVDGTAKAKLGEIGVL